MKYYIDGIDFWNLEPQRYYAPPKSWSAEKIKDITTSRIFSGEWWGAQKRDGAFYKFIKDEDGNMFLIGRSKSKSGDYLDKYEWVPHLHSFFESLPNGTCLLGELYMPRDEQAKTTTSIMNCLQPKAIKRQEKEENKLHYYIFDILADDGQSLIDCPAQDRFDILNSCWRAYGEEYHEWAEYYTGKELWNILQDLLANGYEGVVITRGGAPYQPGKRPSKDCLKVKKELQETIDCVIIASNPPTRLYGGKEIEEWQYWFNNLTNEKILASDYLNKNHRTIYGDYTDGAPVEPVTKNWFYGWAGSLQLGLYDKEHLIHVGDLSGINEEMRENWKNYIGKVVEISCMEISEDKNGKKGFRHPRLISIRTDKEPKECSLEQIY